MPWEAEEGQLIPVMIIEVLSFSILASRRHTIISNTSLVAADNFISLRTFFCHFHPAALYTLQL